jgi:uncharacterized protein (TIGR03118 family)
MRSLTTCAAHAAVLTASILGAVVSGVAAGFVETDLVANQIPLTDSNGVVHTAKTQDPNLQNPWGLVTSGTSPFWVSDNGAGVATLYNTAGTPVPLPPNGPLVVSIPTPGDALGNSGAPTGVVFNIAFTTSTPPPFPITGVTSTNAPITASARFIFATEDGTIVGWNPAVNPPGFDKTKVGTYGIIALNSQPNLGGNCPALC